MNKSDIVKIVLIVCGTAIAITAMLTGKEVPLSTIFSLFTGAF